MPFRGVILAPFLPFALVRQEMGVGSVYLKSLVENLDATKVHALHARFDNFVGSRNSYLDSLFNICIDVLGHNYLHSCYPRVFKEIKRLVADK